MPFIERLQNQAQQRIPSDGAQAILAERGVGAITEAEMLSVIEGMSGEALAPDERAEAALLVDSIASAPDRALRIDEIRTVFVLLENNLPPYDDAAWLRTRLGLPAP